MCGNKVKKGDILNIIKDEEIKEFCKKYCDDNIRFVKTKKSIAKSWFLFF